MRGSSGVKRVGKYELGRTLGEGNFAKVKLGQDVESGRRVAIKVMDKDRILQHRMADQIKREVSIMKMVRHPNIVQLIEVHSNAYMDGAVAPCLSVPSRACRPAGAGVAQQDLHGARVRGGRRALRPHRVPRAAGGERGAAVLPTTRGRRRLLPRQGRLPPRP
ncbi:unnamed protein product [Closterium sp. NIES-53]